MVESLQLPFSTGHSTLIPTVGSVIDKVPQYALKSEHSIIQAYVIKKYEIGNVRKAREILEPGGDTKSSCKRLEGIHGDVEHAYGLTFPVRRSDFVVFDVDEPVLSTYFPSGKIAKLVEVLKKSRIVERIDVLISSAFILRDDDHEKLWKYKYHERDMFGAKYHVYAKLDGVYDCYSFFRSREIQTQQCTGFFLHSIMHGESTIRISEKFNTPIVEHRGSMRVSDSLRPNLLRGGLSKEDDYHIEGFHAPRIITEPLLMFSGSREDNFNFKDYREYITKRLTVDRVHELLIREAMPPKKRINLRQEG